MRLLADGFDRVAGALPSAVDSLEPASILWRPSPAANSIGWLLWHLARVEDDHLTGVAAATGVDVTGAQVWLSEGWSDRFGLPYPERSIGYGQTAQEVGAFDVADADLLLGYYAAVHRRTREILASLSEAHLAAVVDERWDPPVTAAVRLVSVLNDITAHYGQVAYLRGLVDQRSAQ
ncbi:MAG: DUF664 domain-containing protein [Actinobacteria bacterium]|nr:MAG: DUF664 domain-containing protein [Actinomycetota bacterium]